jgi:hypothetical protein
MAPGDGWVPTVPRTKFIPKLIASISFAAAVLTTNSTMAGTPAHRSAAAQQSSQTKPPNPRSPLLQATLAHQHADDQALSQFERVEHQELREHASDATPQTDRTTRFLPTGAGFARIELADHGRSVDPATLRRELTNVQHALEDAAAGVSDTSRTEIQKEQRRGRERAEILDAIIYAFSFTEQGHETLNGHDTVKYRLDPDPNYKARSRESEFLKHATATLWLDVQDAQVMQIDAQLTSDVWFGMGIVAKIYRGGHLFLQQSEVEPGIWLPSYYQADFTGRKFLFLFEYHEKTATSQYQRVGGPAQSLAMIQRELAAMTDKP